MRIANLLWPIVVCVGALIPTVRADDVLLRYEGNAFPEASGWTREPFGNPTRAIDQGEFVQFFDEPTDQDFYRRSLNEFVGTQSFFAEWRMQSSAPASLLGQSQIPTAFVLGGSGAAFYHVIVADSRVQFLRDTNIPLVFVDIDPSLPHTYRIELLGDLSYTFLIDGQVVDRGIPEGLYPYQDARIVWGARFYEPGQTVEWDYIRYGMIPEPGTISLLIFGIAAIRTAQRKKAC